MVAWREVMAGMLVCVLLAVALSAQQLAGSPLCGIVSLDTLKETQSFVRVTAWREEPIEQELQRTRAMLRTRFRTHCSLLLLRPLRQVDRREAAV